MRDGRGVVKGNRESILFQQKIINYFVIYVSCLICTGFLSILLSIYWMGETAY